MDDPIRHNLLYRLRWNLQAPVEEVTIMTGPLDDAITVPLLGHPLASESLAITPLSCIEVDIKDFGNKVLSEFAYDEEDRYKPPPALKIENQNNVPITIGQFVQRVHAYVGEHLEEIKKLKGETYGELVTNSDGSVTHVITFGRPVRLPEDIGIYFWRVMYSCRPSGSPLRVYLYAEGEQPWSLERFWDMRSSKVRKHESSQ